MRGHLACSLFVLSVGCGDNLLGAYPPVIDTAPQVTPEDTTLARTLDVVDLDGDELKLSIAAQPMHGSAGWSPIG